jgi:hypothetical protein
LGCRGLVVDRRRRAVVLLRSRSSLGWRDRILVLVDVRRADLIVIIQSKPIPGKN